MTTGPPSWFLLGAQAPGERNAPTSVIPSPVYITWDPCDMKSSGNDHHELMTNTSLFASTCLLDVLPTDLKLKLWLLGGCPSCRSLRWLLFFVLGWSTRRREDLWLERKTQWRMIDPLLVILSCNLVWAKCNSVKIFVVLCPVLLLLLLLLLLQFWWW